ncbi:MAG: archease [candidate division FCPU426 bacterium]
MNPFEILEHTADAGLRIRGETPEALFAHAAQGLYALALTAPPAGAQPEKTTLQLAGDGLASLLVIFLEELVYRLYTRRQAAVRVEAKLALPGRVTIEAAFVPISPEAFAAEIKSPTYHGLKVEQGSGGWLAEVYFDL